MFENEAEWNRKCQNALEAVKASTLHDTLVSVVYACAVYILSMGIYCGLWQKRCESHWVKALSPLVISMKI